MNEQLNIIFNGKLQSSSLNIIGPDNRGLRFGDGCFETLLVQNGIIELKDLHFQRLFASLATLQFKLPVHFTAGVLQEKITQLVTKNNHSLARVRLTFFRGDGGIFENMQSFNWLIQSWPLQQEGYSLNTNGSHLCIYNEAQKTTDIYSSIKHNNFLPYTMGAMYAKAKKCNDAIILNSRLGIADTTIANIFCFKNKKIYTPPLSEGCIAGVMRNYLLQTLPQLGFTCVEQPLKVQDILAADEVFTTNSIKRIQWVRQIEDSSFSNEQIAEIITSLKRTKYPVFL